MWKVIVWVCIIGLLGFALGQSTMITNWLEEKYVNVDPDNPEAPKLLYQMGNYCYFLSNHENGMRLFSRIVEEYPYSDWAAPSLFMIGKSHEKRGEILQAKLVLRRIEKEYPADEEHIELANKKIKEMSRY